MVKKNNLIVCSKCGGECKVIDTVMNTDTNERYRRRRCGKCGNDFYTLEFEVEADIDFLENWYNYHRGTLSRRNGG